VTIDGAVVSVESPGPALVIEGVAAWVSRRVGRLGGGWEKDKKTFRVQSASTLRQCFGAVFRHLTSSSAVDYHAFDHAIANI